MRTRRVSLRIVWPGVLLCLALTGGCGPGPAPSQSTGVGGGALDVFVSISPLAFLAVRVGGEHVRVHTLLSPGQGPHTFTATPKQVMALGEAAAYFHVGGFPFERELAKRVGASFPSLAVQDLSQGIARRTDLAHGHAEESPAQHAGEEWDPHVWMSPPMLETMATAAAQTLKRIDPAHADDYDQNLGGVLDDLEVLDRELREKLAPYKGDVFYIYHPALGYFAETYGLHQKSVEVGGKKPAPRQLQELIEQARKDGVRVIFVQPQFDQRAAESVAEAIEGSVAPVDPLREDVLANLREIATSLAEAFAAEKTP
ncbi:MAG TPA: zinc ABC transporter substrate-binding protein [Candidatus Hydrogenedentes bacterium]|nr:zinc ABC transporter substrate-binding protein [Candidatus Hydrogenedentota bacterium]HQH53779.1 zinc ABC transporter substrate-binding protein [Candidatus Hydrogenedentota bacterium]HQM47938.1 zinc ABC transporter substrate-binding protein [Candidatus Hydrogenedentota bacterium]